MTVHDPNQLIPTKELIRKAQASGFDFGKGNPNNRLRYWTKIGLLPHAVRKKIGRNAYTQGHYPAYVLDLLKKIQLYKKTSLNKSEIKKRLQKEQAQYAAQKAGIKVKKSSSWQIPISNQVIEIPKHLSLALLSLLIITSSLLWLALTPSGQSSLDQLNRLFGRFLAQVIQPYLTGKTTPPLPKEKVAGEKTAQTLKKQAILSPLTENFIINSSFEYGIESIDSKGSFGQPWRWGYTDYGHHGNMYVTNDSIRSGTVSLTVNDTLYETQPSSDPMTLGLTQQETQTINGRDYLFSLWVRTQNLVGSPTLRLGFTGTASSDDPNYHGSGWTDYSQDKYQDFSLAANSPTSEVSEDSTSEVFLGGDPSKDWTQYNFQYQNAALGKYPFIKILNYRGGKIFLDDLTLVQVRHSEGALATEESPPLTEGDPSASTSLRLRMTEGLEGPLFNQTGMSLGDRSIKLDAASNLYPQDDKIGRLGLANKRFSGLYTDWADFDNTLRVGGRVTLEENLSVAGAATISGKLKISGSLDLGLTQGSVTFIDSAGKLTQDNANFYWNDTNNRLGIGTATPLTSLHISGTDGLILPVGTTAQRPSTSTTGTIRYNSTTSQFEGYGTANWGSLGGVIDVDQDTYVSAETSPGADNDELLFYTAGSQRAKINSSGHFVPGADSTYNLGASGTEWSTIYVDTLVAGAIGSGGNLDLDGNKLIFDTDGDTSMQADTDDQIDIEIAGADDFQFTANTLTALSGSNFTAAGNVDIVIAGSATTPIDIGADVFASGTLIDIDYDTAETQTGALTGIDLDFTNLTTSGSHAFYGIHLNDQVGSTGSTEYGIYVEGTNWDYGIYSADDVYIATALTIAGSAEGTNALTLNAGDITITDGDLTLSGGEISATSDDTTGTNFSFTTAATSGIGFGLIADTVTTGTGLSISLDALTSGTGVLVESAPGSATTLSGDLFKINVGANVTNTGNLFAVYNNSSDVFKVSTTQIESAVPHSFTATGDVSIAYDIVMTNQTASYIKSYGPLYLEAGETFESNNLNLKTYNSGNIVLDSASGNLWADGSKVGIGQTSPGAKLEVEIGSTDALAGLLVDQDDLDQIGLQIVQAANATANALDISSLQVSGDLVDIDYSAAETQTGALTGIDVDFTNLTADGTNALYGIHLNDQVGATGSTEYGLYIEGTNWDYGIYSADDIYLATDFTMAGGNLNFNNATDIDIDDATANALTISEGSNNYLNITTTDSSETLQFGNTTTNPSYSFLGTSAVTIAGSAEGTNALTLTLGDITITDGDLTLSGGEISATSDDTTGTNFSFTTAATSGTGFGLIADTVTTGTGLSISLDALTSGTGVLIESAPGTSTTLSGDLFKINVGANVLNTGNLFAVYNNSSDVFKVSTTQIESAVPHSFTATGDVSIAYDILMTNPTAAYLTFEGPGYLRTNHPSGNYDLTLSAANTGYVIANDRFVVDQDDTDDTALDIDIANVSGDVINLDWNAATTQTGALTGLDLDFTNLTTSGSHAFYGLHLNDQASTTASTEYGIYIEGTNWDYGLYSADNVYIATDLTIAGGDITGANGAALDLGEATSGDITVTGDLIVADNSWLGLSSSTGRIEFDDQTIDEVNILSAKAGIGTSTPGALLEVNSGSTAIYGRALAIFDHDENQDLLTASASSIPKFRVDQSGNIFTANLTTLNTTAVCYNDVVYNGVTFKQLTDCNGSAGDIAEWFPVTRTVAGNSSDNCNSELQFASEEERALKCASTSSLGGGFPDAGDIVAITDQIVDFEEPLIDPVTGKETGQKASRKVAVLAKASQSYQSEMIGVVSENPYQVLGDALLKELEGAAKARSPRDTSGVKSSNTPEVEELATSEIKPAPIALIGRAPVKIAPDSQSIQPGDFLTSSNTYPGLTMKATQAGYTIGKALEPWPNETSGNENKVMADINPGWSPGTDSTEVETLGGSDESSPSASLEELMTSIGSVEDGQDLKLSAFEAETATISSTLQVLGKTTLSDLGVTGQITTGLLTIDGLSVSDPGSGNSFDPGSNSLFGGASISTLSGPLHLQELALGDLSIMNSKIQIDTKGNLKLVEGVLYANEQMRGAATLSPGQTTKRLEKDWPQSPVTVNITPSWQTTVWVTNISQTGFTIHVSTAPTQEAKLYWVAVW